MLVTINVLLLVVLNISVGTLTKENTFINEDQKLPFVNGLLQALTQILDLNPPFDLCSRFTGSLLLLGNLIWLR